MAEGAECCPCWTQGVLWSHLADNRNHPASQMRIPILPQIKPWLLQHLPQSSVCITSYSGRAVWEASAFARVFMPARRLFKSSLLRSQAVLRAVIASVLWYWSTSKVSDSLGNIISPTKQWSKYIVFSIFYLLSISPHRVTYLIQTPWSHTSLVQPFSIIYWTMEVGMDWVLLWSIISSFSNWVSKRWYRCIEVTTC